MPELIKIPIFPLPIVVFPDEEIRLHIFEPRYKQLIRDCNKTGIAFGIIPIIDNKIMQVGALVKLVDIVKEYEDGRMDIKLSCIGKFEVFEKYNNWPGKLYSAADIIMMDPSVDKILKLNLIVQDLFNELCAINNAKPYHPILWDDFQSYKLAHYVGFSIEEEYLFNSLQNEKDRLENLIKQIEYMIIQSKQRQEWLKRMNMNGEFRNFNIKDIK